jgi:hypothetical protein
MEEINEAICPIFGRVVRDKMKGPMFQLGPVEVKPLPMIDWKIDKIKFRYGKVVKNDPPVQ